MGVCCWHNYTQETGCSVCGQHLAIHGGHSKPADLYVHPCSWAECQVVCQPAALAWLKTYLIPAVFTQGVAQWIFDGKTLLVDLRKAHADLVPSIVAAAKAAGFVAVL